MDVSILLSILTVQCNFSDGSIRGRFGELCCMVFLHDLGWTFINVFICFVPGAHGAAFFPGAVFGAVRVLSACCLCLYLLSFVFGWLVVCRHSIYTSCWGALDGPGVGYVDQFVSFVFPRCCHSVLHVRQVWCLVVSQLSGFISSPSYLAAGLTRRSRMMWRRISAWWSLVIPVWFFSEIIMMVEAWCRTSCGCIARGLGF